jgi:hypothetical protein
MKWKYAFLLILCTGLLLMNANDILNNTDPNEIRNILKRLKLNADAGNRPPSTVIINQAPNQYPSTPTTNDSDLIGLDPRRYLAAYNYYLGVGASGPEYKLGLAHSATGRGDWIIDKEPVISLGSSGAWDDALMKDPNMLLVNGVLYLYFAANPTVGVVSDFKIGLARSYDGGVTWEKYASNPVINNNIAWENSNVLSPRVLYDRDETNASKRWKMWYGGSGFGTGIGYAYSADGLSWTKAAGNPLMTLGTSGQWDDEMVVPLAVIRRGSEFILFYCGYDGSTWRNGYVTFTDPEGTYTRSANNPILGGDGITTTLTADLAAGSTTATVSDATVFPIGCPVWLGYSTRFLTHVKARTSATIIELADPAPATIASGQMVRSIAYNSIGITGVHYDDGYKFTLNVIQPDGVTQLGVHELSMIGYANDDLKQVFFDYGAGLQIPIAVVESQNTNVSRENVSVVDTYDQDRERHKPAALPGDMFKSVYDADNDGIVDNAEQLQGHPASDFLLNANRFSDAEGDPADVSTGSAADGTSNYSARRDHVHHYEPGATSSGGAGQVSGIARWSSGGGTAFDLPDVAEYLLSAFDNGSLVDPFTYALSSDRTQIVFDSSITAGHVVVTQYILAQV